MGWEIRFMRQKIFRSINTIINNILIKLQSSNISVPSVLAVSVYATYATSVVRKIL